MILTVLTKGNSILRKESKRVAKIDDEIRTLCDDMIETMYAHSGVGLAAPQVGILKRIIVIDEQGTPRVFINPNLINVSTESILMEEGCLSIPNHYVKIKRPEQIHIRYRTLEGKPMYETLTGLSARILQHELDHLDGLLFIDYES